MFRPSLELINLYPNTIIPSFDVAGGNPDMIEVVCQYSAESSKPFFISSTPSSIDDYKGIDYFVESSRYFIDKYSALVTPHIDHCDNLDFLRNCLKLGLKSLMYDGSQESFKQNIENTRIITQEAENFGATIEAELGLIFGKEDNVINSKSAYPTIKECEQFIQETNVHLFAPAIGTVHGVNLKKMDLQWELIGQLKDSNTPLVLHGGSGLSKDQIHRILEAPFVKINYATECRKAYLEGYYSSLKSHGTLKKPQFHIQNAKNELLKFIQESSLKLINN